ncbi:hypothetical protein NX059_008656 [Plenodomus lindquistii]|nr:hypothetical protein NX059_008656 [Plenodomus lindquistii]
MPPDAPEALGASGIPVPCVPTDERDGVGAPDVLAELPAAVTLDASEADGDADIEARDAEELIEYGGATVNTLVDEDACADVETVKSVLCTEDGVESDGTMAVLEDAAVAADDGETGGGIKVAETDVSGTDVVPMIVVNEAETALEAASDSAALGDDDELRDGEVAMVELTGTGIGMTTVVVDTDDVVAMMEDAGAGSKLLAELC